MNLINYLNENYYTKQQLLDLSKISDAQLIEFQNKLVMPRCSYRLAISYNCNSFFGDLSHQDEIEYYARGYLSWIGMLKVTKDLQDIYQNFSLRYRQSITELKCAGHKSNSDKVHSNLDLHVKDEWGNFLRGIYGLCTKSGLPEDIAAKEFATLEINEILEAKDARDIDIERLTKAVNLLDSSSSMFAPHERLNSSRQRLVNDVRQCYNLKRTSPE